MSTLTGHIEFRSEHLPARIIHDEFCISTAGVARAVGRHPGRIRNILSHHNNKPGSIVPGAMTHRINGTTWWAPMGVYGLTAHLSDSPARTAAIDLWVFLNEHPTLLPDPEPSDAALAGHMMAHSGVSPAPELPAPGAGQPG